MKRTKIMDAYAFAKPVRDVLHEQCRCMEVTEDKAGIVWERWLTPAGVSLVFFGTPTWCDVFAPFSHEMGSAKWLEELRLMIASPRRNPKV